MTGVRQEKLAVQFALIAEKLCELSVAFFDLSDIVAEPIAAKPAPGDGQAPRESQAVSTTHVAPSAPAPASGQTMWTEARDDVLRERVPTGRPTAEILAAVNALPGERVPNGSFIDGRSSALGLRRPEGWNPVTQCVDAPQAIEPPPPPKPAPAISAPARSSEPYVLFTPARNAIIKRDWQAGVHADVIMRRCNDLFGKPITNPARIGIQASALGVKRPDGFNPHCALRPRDDYPDAPPAPSKSVEILQDLPKPPSPLEPSPPVVEQQAPRTPAAPPQLPAKPAQPVAFTHQAAPVRMAPAKPPLPIHAPPPKPVAKPSAAAVVDLPVRTPEREERIRAGVARKETIGQIVSAVNCRPGGKITTAELEAWISELKLRPEQPRIAGDLRSEPRRRVLVAAFAAGDAHEQIVFKLNVLDGPKFDVKLLQNWIADLKLTRVVQDAHGLPLKGLPRKDWNTALQWALAQGVKFPAGCGEKIAERVINQAREEAGLPQWQITEPNRPRVGIPGHAILRRKDTDSHAA